MGRTWQPRHAPPAPVRSPSPVHLARSPAEGAGTHSCPPNPQHTPTCQDPAPLCSFIRHRGFSNGYPDPCSCFPGDTWGGGNPALLGTRLSPGLGSAWGSNSTARTLLTAPQSCQGGTLLGRALPRCQGGGRGVASSPGTRSSGSTGTCQGPCSGAGAEFSFPCMMKTNISPHAGSRGEISFSVWPGACHALQLRSEIPKAAAAKHPAHTEERNILLLQSTFHPRALSPHLLHSVAPRLGDGARKGLMLCQDAAAVPGLEPCWWQLGKDKSGGAG